MVRTIKELVRAEVIYCVSSLIHTLTQENKLEEELVIELWTAPIDYDAAKYELELERDEVFKHFCYEDNQYYFGVRNNDLVWRIDPIHNDEETAIYEWFKIYRGGGLEDYRSCILEHWLVTSWLADKLEAKGETVVRDFYGLEAVWVRCCSGSAIWTDWVIEQIYQELIKQYL